MLERELALVRRVLSRSVCSVPTVFLSVLSAACGCFPSGVGGSLWFYYLLDLHSGVLLVSPCEDYKMGGGVRVPFLPPSPRPHLTEVRSALLGCVGCGCFLFCLCLCCFLGFWCVCGFNGRGV